MNRTERLMLAILRELHSEYGATYVRAEFEAEGLRMEELLRLKDISVRAGFALSLKIGGCEGVRDLIESKMVGADAIVAPMIESAFALRKFDQAAHKVYSPEECEHTKFWFNLETKSAVKSAQEILSSPAAQRMGAAVIERVDLCFSMGKAEDDVDNADVCEIVNGLLSTAKENQVRTVLGGGVSHRSVDFIEDAVRGKLLDHYETRKIGFGTDGLTRERYLRSLLLAIGFEIQFLKNKLQNTRNMAERDLRRLSYLDTTYWHDVKHVLPATY